jgi:1-acyl-sn-glycerol-3-phosphate acyltransferase
LFYWILRSIIWVVLHILFAIYGGIRFEGRHNVPRKGGVLIAPNHISDSDPPTVGLALPRACYFMAKEELFAMPYIGTLIRWMRGFPVKRYTADRTALKRAEALLEQGEAVVIFPEGKLSEDGTLQPMLPGALLVAQRANVPIVPTILEGTDKLMPYGTLKPRHAGRRIIVRFGPPVTVAELTGGVKGGDALKLGAERLGQIMQALQQNRPYPKFESSRPKDPRPAEPPQEDKQEIKALKETSALRSGAPASV